MDSGPALFSGTAFLLFGAGLLLWTATCVRRSEPVVQGVRPVAGAVFSVLAGGVACCGGIWFLGYV